MSEEIKFATREEWRTIPGYEGFYEVSDLGNVRRLVYRNQAGIFPYIKPRYLKPRFRQGYPSFTLTKDDRPAYPKAHKLVMLAFIGPTPKGLQIAHNDGDSRNPALSNLRFATPLENNHDRFKHGTVLRGHKHPRAKLSEYQVSIIRQADTTPEIIRELSRMFNVTRGTIRSIRRGLSWK